MSDWCYKLTRWHCCPRQNVSIPTYCVTFYILKQRPAVSFNFECFQEYQTLFFLENLSVSAIDSWIHLVFLHCKASVNWNPFHVICIMNKREYEWGGHDDLTKSLLPCSHTSFHPSLPSSLPPAPPHIHFGLPPPSTTAVEDEAIELSSYSFLHLLPLLPEWAHLAHGWTAPQPASGEDPAGDGVSFSSPSQTSEASHFTGHYHIWMASVVKERQCHSR